MSHVNLRIEKGQLQTCNTNTALCEQKTSKDV